MHDIVDVSEHNGIVDWQAVKDAGWHAIIRSSFGTEAEGRKDLQFDRNADECERLGIPYGVYHYSYATSPASAASEARLMLGCIGGRRPDYPLFFDSEEPSTAASARENAVAFCTEVERAGFWAGVYASESWWLERLSGLEERYVSWVANWTRRPTGLRTDLWQRSDSEQVPGVGKADANEQLRDLLSDMAAAAAPQAQAPQGQAPAVSGGLGPRGRAVEVMLHLCRHDGDAGHGYSQARRWGDGTDEALELSDGSRVSVARGDYDCSSAVVTAWEAALPGSTGGATYTGDMEEGFLSTGLWEWHDWDDDYVSRPGDLALNRLNHTAMFVSEGFDLAQFSIAEDGSVAGRQGDQTAWESSVVPFYVYGRGGWDGVLAYVGPGSAPTLPAAPTGPTSALAVQEGLNVRLAAFGLAPVAEDGVDGPETQAGVARLYQASCNLDYGAGLAVDGVVGPATRACAAAHPVGLGFEESGNDAWCVKAGLALAGRGTGVSDWLWGAAEDAALRSHQAAAGVASDGVCGGETLHTLLPLASV